MKKLLTICILFMLLLQPSQSTRAEAPQPAQPDGITMTNEGMVSQAAPGQMPGYAEPLQPIQYNKPGYPSTMNTDNRVKLASEYEPWKSEPSLQNVDAQTVSASLDPLAGNHTLVNWDELGIISTTNNIQNIRTFNEGVLDPSTGDVSMRTTPVLDKSSPLNLTGIGTTRVGDINGDGIDELVSYSNNYLQVSNLSDAPKFKGTPGIISQPFTGTLFLAERGYDDQLWVSRNGGVSWLPAGGTLIAGVSAVSIGSQSGIQMNVLTMSTDHHIYRCIVTGFAPMPPATCSFEDLGGAPNGQGYFIGEPAIAAADANTIDVFVRGSDNTLWHKSYRSSIWSAWEPLGGYITSSPAAVMFGGKLDVVARGYDNAVWHMSRASDASAWSAWDSLGGITLGAPSITAIASGVMEIYAVGGDNALWSRLYQNAAWGSWVTEGGGTISPSPAATVIPGTQKVVVAVRSSTGQTLLISRGSPSGAWSAYSTMSALPAWGNSYSESNWSNFVLGHFLPDGRMQAVTPYLTGSGPYALKLDLYSFQGGFAPTLVGTEIPVSLASPVTSSNNHLWGAAGDFDGDGVDELALAVYDQGGNGIVTLYIFKLDATGIILQGNLKVDTSSHIRMGITTGNYLSGTATPVMQQVALVDGMDNSDSASLQIFSATANSSGYTVKNENSSSINWDRYNYGRDNEFGVASGNFGGTPTSGDQTDEIVVAGISEHYSVSDADDQYKLQISLYKYDGSSSMAEVGSETSDEVYNHISPSDVSIKLDALDADVDRDGQAEIVTYFERQGQERADFYKWDTNTSTLTQKAVLNLPDGNMAPASLVVAGDFEGNGLVVGAPTYRVIKDARGLVAQISVPPRIKGVNDGSLTATDLSKITATSEVNFGAESTVQFTVTAKSHWNLDVSASATIGNEESSYLKLSLESTYGQDFEKTDTNYSKLSYTDQVTADQADEMVYSLTDYKMYEYPVNDSAQNKQTHMTVAWPTTNAALTFIPSNTCGVVINTGHEVNNPLSYPATETGLKDYSGTNLVNTSFTTGNKINFTTDLENSQSTTLSKSSNWTIAAGIEGQYQAPIPLTLGFSVRGEYGQSTAATQDYSAKQDLGIAVNVSELLANYQYTLKPYVYWGSTGALMLDFVMNPPNPLNPYWTTTWAAHPDLAFLRPWKDSSCGNGQENLSPEITFSNDTPKSGDNVTVTARVHNFSLANASGVQVLFYDGDPASGGTQLSCSNPANPGSFSLDARAYRDVSCGFTASGTGEKRVYAVVDPANSITELDETNNKAFGRYTMASSAAGSADPGDSDIKDGQLFSFTDPAGKLTQFFAPFQASDSMLNYRLDRLLTSPAGLSATNLGSAGHFFTISALQNDSSGNWGPTDVTFGAADHTIPTAMVAVQYTDSDIRFMDESTLKLYMYAGGWVDASCGTIQRFPSQNLLLVPVCQTGTFALMGQIIKFPVYLPVVKK